MHMSLWTSQTQDNGAANILKQLPPSEYAHARRVVIHMILATDMCQHTEHCARATKLLHRAKQLRAVSATTAAHCIDIKASAATGTLDVHARRRSHYGVSANSAALRFQRHSCDGNASRRGSTARARSHNDTEGVTANAAAVAAADTASVGTTMHAGAATGPVQSTPPTRYNLISHLHHRILCT
jgi:3'5'-cyclic nucleotide phosphodiesterase